MTEVQQAGMEKLRVGKAMGKVRVEKVRVGKMMHKMKTLEVREGDKNENVEGGTELRVVEKVVMVRGTVEGGNGSAKVPGSGDSVPSSESCGGFEGLGVSMGSDGFPGFRGSVPEVRKVSKVLKVSEVLGVRWVAGFRRLGSGVSEVCNLTEIKVIYIYIYYIYTKLAGAHNRTFLDISFLCYFF